MFTAVYIGLAIGIPAITYGVCEFAIQEWSDALRNYAGLALSLVGAATMIYGGYRTITVGRDLLSLMIPFAALAMVGFGILLRGAPKKA